MKVEKVTSGNSTVEILLEPEHPAESALVNLLGECEAQCTAIDQKPSPEANIGMSTPSPLPPQLRITITVKKNGISSRY